MVTTGSLSQRTLAFRQCEFCAYDLATGEGERGCHYYECPYLPEELDVRCPVCTYNFYTQDGNPCDTPVHREFAREVAPQRVANLEAWLEATGRMRETVT